MHFLLVQQVKHLSKSITTKLAIFPFLICWLIDLNFNLSVLVSVKDCKCDSQWWESHVSFSRIKSSALFWLKPVQKLLVLAGSVTCNLVLQGTMALCYVTVPLGQILWLMLLSGVKSWCCFSQYGLNRPRTQLPSIIQEKGLWYTDSFYIYFCLQRVTSFIYLRNALPFFSLYLVFFVVRGKKNQDQNTEH